MSSFSTGVEMGKCRFCMIIIKWPSAALLVNQLFICLFNQLFMNLIYTAKCDSRLCVLFDTS